MLRKAAEAIVLWVDDDPSQNVHERQALEALGVEFNLAKTTMEALDLATGRRSATTRSSPTWAAPRVTAPGTRCCRSSARPAIGRPVVVYSGSPKEEHRAEALKKGAFGATSRPESELFQLVLDAISASR